MDQRTSITHYCHAACCGGHWIAVHDARLATVTIRCERCGKPGLTVDGVPGDIDRCCTGSVELAVGGGLLHLLCDSCMEPLLVAPADEGLSRAIGPVRGS